MTETLRASLLERAAVVLAAGDIKGRLMWVLRDMAERYYNSTKKYGPPNHESYQHCCRELDRAINVVMTLAGLEWKYDPRLVESYEGGILKDAGLRWQREERTDIEAHLKAVERELDHIEEASAVKPWCKYIPWAANHAEECFRESKLDPRSCAQAIREFTEMAAKKTEGLPSKDINHYKSFADLIRAVNGASVNKKMVVWESDDYTVWRCDSKQSLASMTPQGGPYGPVWCVGRPEQQHYESYKERGPDTKFFVFVANTTNESMALVFVNGTEVEEVKDEHDEELVPGNPVIEAIHAFCGTFSFEWDGPADTRMDASDWVARYLVGVNSTRIRTEPSGNNDYIARPLASVLQAVRSDVAFVSRSDRQDIAHDMEDDAHAAEISIDGDIDDALLDLIRDAYDDTQMSFVALKRIFGSIRDMLEGADYGEDLGNFRMINHGTNGWLVFEIGSVRFTATEWTGEGDLEDLTFDLTVP